MCLKYFNIDLPTLIQLKDYLCGVLKATNGQAIARQAIKSLSELMCEFDTMSETGEVINMLYAEINQAMEQEKEIIGK